MNPVTDVHNNEWNAVPVIGGVYLLCGKQATQMTLEAARGLAERLLAAATEGAKQ